MRKATRLSSDSVGRFLDERVARWRSGSSDGQSGVLVALIVLTGIIFGGSVLNFQLFPLAMFMVPILLGGLLLRYSPLRLLSVIVLAAAFSSLLVDFAVGAEMMDRGATFFVLLLLTSILLYSVKSTRSGLPARLGDAMLMDLRDRLQRQSEVPQLPRGWHAESILSTAGGARFSGDFFAVSLSNESTLLEVVLVDVCGKGVQAGTQSLQLAGAIGGLLGSLPPQGLFAAANDYLLKQNWNDGFATAVHLIVDLRTGKYEIANAGHPPAVINSSYEGVWKQSAARGVALGIIERPNFESERGVMVPGDTIILYTDGLVESRDQDVSDGIAWLKKTAADVTSVTALGAAKRIIDKAQSAGDDRAIFVLHRKKQEEDLKRPLRRWR